MAQGKWRVSTVAWEAEVDAALEEVLGWLRRADVLLIVAPGGAEGPPPPGTEAPEPLLFGEDPAAAWARWLPHHQAAFSRRTPACSSTLGRWCQQAPLGGLLCTADTSGSWRAAGWPQGRLVELAGSARRLQCSEPCGAHLWPAVEDLCLPRVENGRTVGSLPSCAKCGAVSRPWVRLARWDEAYIDGEPSWLPALATLAAWLPKISEPTILQLELGDSAMDEGYREALDEVIGGFRAFRFKRVVLSAEVLTEQVPGTLRVPLDWPLAVEKLHRLYMQLPLATYIVTDAEGGGAEVAMPSDTTALRVFLRTAAEFEGRLDWRDENLVLMANHLYSACGRRTVALDLDGPVSGDLMTKLRDGEDYEVGVAVKVWGCCFPGRNGRLHERILGVRSLLFELLAQFRTQEYQERLALASDQAEVKALIKEVHASVIPKYGFPLTMDMDIGKTIKAQICMQTYIDSVTPMDDVLSNFSGETLVHSGVSKLHTLPVRIKGKDRLRVSREKRSFHFKHHDPAHPLLYGTWLGDWRAPAAFVEAPCYDLLTFLREDPDGPFSSRVDEWPRGEAFIGGEEHSRWRKWGFVRDRREQLLKSDWHTLPQDELVLFVPRMGKAATVQRAPPRYLAFAKAFRDVNRDLFKSLASALKELAVARMGLDTIDTDGSLLMTLLAQCIEQQGGLGVIEAQVWWGDEPVTLPSHKDGATSLLHLGLTLGGTRTLRVGTYPSPDDWPASKGRAEASVWDTPAWTRAGQLASGLKDLRQVRGCAYLSSPYCFEHGVRCERGTRDEPVIALQCRVAFSPELGPMLNGMRDDLMLAVSSSVASLLKRTSESGQLRMPSLEEVLQHYRLPKAA